MASQPDARNTILDTGEGKRLATAQAPGLAPIGAVCQRPAMGHGSGDSEGGAAWDYLPHDYALSRAYRCGEEAIGGHSDGGQRWCLGVALWNKCDPIPKELLCRQRAHPATYV